MVQYLLYYCMSNKVNSDKLANLYVDNMQKYANLLF